jgi:type IV pilus assembly protein PilV
MRNAMTRESLSRPGRQGGVMLLEVLIGILIFSIGILAMLGMQTIGMRNTVESKYRSEASYLAAQIVGTMWVDQANLPSYDDAGVGNSRRTNWVAEVQARLPQATGANAPSILVNGSQVTVTLRWLRPGEAAADFSRHVVIAQINGRG